MLQNSRNVTTRLTVGESSGLSCESKRKPSDEAGIWVIWEPPIFLRTWALFRPLVSVDVNLTGDGVSPGACALFETPSLAGDLSGHGNHTPPSEFSWQRAGRLQHSVPRPTMVVS